MGYKSALIGRKTLQPFFERMYRISLRGMNYGMAAFVESSGEEHLIGSIQSILKKERLTIFDVGSNDGDYVIHLVDRIGTNHDLHLFEPSKKSFDDLNVRLSSKSVDSLKLNNYGLSSKKGSASLYYDQEGTGWASVHQIKHQHLGVELDKKESIELKTLDEYCLEHSIDSIDFMKMDVEGHEKEVLLGANKMISSGKINSIQFEFGIAHLVSKVFLREFFEILEDFRIYRILQDGIYEIKYSERYEIFLNSNYFALKKAY